MCPAKVEIGEQRGFVIPIGGAEERIDNPIILQKFVTMCGAQDADIVIIPTASQREETGPDYIEVFQSLGVKQVKSLDINSREEANLAANIQALEQASGIFMTGGNQLRLSTILGGTAFMQVMRRANAAGVHIAGTSAGAAIMPEHMIAGGPKGPLPNEAGVTFAPGMGLINKIILDQHFSQRNRLGRLLSAVSYNPFCTGIGIDEDTALFIGPDNQLEVVGSGSVTIIDPSDLTHSSMAHASRGDTLTLIGMKLHMLSQGDKYNLDSRVATPRNK
jgi:cyanophycinase